MRTPLITTTVRATPSATTSATPGATPGAAHGSAAAVRRRALPAMLASALLPVLVAACSSSGGTAAPSTSAAPTGTAPASSTAAPTGSATGSPVHPSPSPTSVTPTATGKGTPLTGAQVRAALLTPAEIGSGLQPTATDPTKQPLPCADPGSQPLDVAVPPQATATASYSSAADDLQVTEEVSSYATPDLSLRALVVAEHGLTCDIGHIGTVQVTIQGPIDVSTSFTTRVEGAELWAISSARGKQSVIIAKMGQRVVTLTFAEIVGANDRSLDAAGIAGRALAKAGAAG